MSRDGANTLLNHRACPYVLVILAALLTFGRSVGYTFLDWDDLLNIAENSALKQPFLSGLVQIWSGPYAQMYIPVVYSTFLLDSIWGSGHPAVFHGVNVLVHAATSCVVYVLICEALRHVHAQKAMHDIEADVKPSALAGALLFALHPLQAEAVSWVTGRKDLLCGLFSVLCLYGFLRWLVRRRTVYLAVASVSMLLALLCKPTAVMLPLLAGALALCFPDRWRASLAALLPWVMISVCWAAFSVNLQTGIGTESAILPVWKRPFLAADSILFYVQKILLPVGLAPIYDRSVESVFTTPAIWLKLPLLIAGLAAAVLGSRIIAISCFWFVVPLLPVSGLYPFQYQSISTVADRYGYISMLGVALAASVALVRPGRQPAHKHLYGTAIVTVLLVLACVSFRQSGHWKNSRTLWERELAVNPANSQALVNLATGYAEESRWALATEKLLQAIRSDPEYAPAYSNLLIVASAAGRDQDVKRTALEIIERFGTRGKTGGGSVASYIALARAYGMTGNSESAIQAYRAALHGDPENAMTWYELALAHREAGDTSASRHALNHALAIEPNSTMALNLITELRLSDKK
ncbi:MAG: tetratricopeptide repeat protein [Candidatus Sumerlaeaceae bacterium]